MMKILKIFRYKPTLKLDRTFTQFYEAQYFLNVKLSKKVLFTLYYIDRIPSNIPSQVILFKDGNSIDL